MPGPDFIYAFPDNEKLKPTSSRKTHILRLNDLLHLFIERGDLQRARRTWAILIRCKEFDWNTKWRTGLLLISDPKSSRQSEGQAKIDFLKKLMRRYPNEQEAILQEIVLHLTAGGKFNEALEELESYLPSFPYQDNPILHCYAGLISMHLAVQESQLNIAQKSTRLKSAQTHLQRTLNIDPENLVASAFITEASELLKRTEATVLQAFVDEPTDEEMDVDGNPSRTRTKKAKKATRLNE